METGVVIGRQRTGQKSVRSAARTHRWLRLQEPATQPPGTGSAPPPMDHSRRVEAPTVPPATSVVPAERSIPALSLAASPGRMVPSRGGVTSSRRPVALFFQKAKKFMVPTSVTSLSPPNSQSTCRGGTDRGEGQRERWRERQNRRSARGRAGGDPARRTRWQPPTGAHTPRPRRCSAPGTAHCPHACSPAGTHLAVALGRRLRLHADGGGVVAAHLGVSQAPRPRADVLVVSEEADGLEALGVVGAHLQREREGERGEYGE